MCHVVIHVTYACFYMYRKYHLATDLSSSEIVVHSFHTLEPAYYVLHQRPGSCCSSGQMIKHIDPNSLWDMNYCIMIVLIALFVFGYRLPSSTIARSTTNSMVISSSSGLPWASNTRSPNHFFQLQRLFSSSHFGHIQTLATMLLSHRKTVHPLT